jgi:peptidoglycan/xylan/chitin deacetylase (PgdA/CDA1 family)
VSGRRLTVLLYHRVTDRRDPGFRGYGALVSATPEAFARQMRYVADRFAVLSLDDLVAVLEGRPPPPRALVVTFDDGYADNHAHALPVLRALGLPAILFLVTGAVGTGHVPWWDESAALIGDGPRLDAHCEALKRLPAEAVEERMRVLRRGSAPPAADGAPLFMGWDEAAEMEAAGVACQPHTHTHPILSQATAAQVRDEVARSAATVRERLGRPALAFAYPSGRAGDYGPDAVDAVAANGMRVEFCTRPGPVRLAGARARPLEVPRVAIDAGDDDLRFRLKVHGASPWAHRARAAGGSVRRGVRAARQRRTANRLR